MNSTSTLPIPIAAVSMMPFQPDPKCQLTSHRLFTQSKFRLEDLRKEWPPGLLIGQDPRERLAYNCKSHRNNPLLIKITGRLSTLNMLRTTQSPHPLSSVPTAVTPDDVHKDAICILIPCLSARSAMVSHSSSVICLLTASAK